MGLLGRGFGTTSTATPPATPTLTASDNGDGTGAVATIAGSTAGSMNRVYTVSAAGGSWTLAGTRTGDGVVALALSAGVYFAYVSSAAGGLSSLSNVATVRVSAASTTDCIPIQVAAAVASEINAAAANGDISQSFTAVFSFGSEIVKMEEVNAAGLTVDVIPANLQDWTHRAGSVYRHDVRIKVGIRRRIAATDRTSTGAVDTSDVKQYVNVLYEIVNLFAAGRSLSALSAAAWNPAVKPILSLYDEAQLKSGLYVGFVHLHFLYHERAA
jgi:hypothetical protein